MSQKRRNDRSNRHGSDQGDSEIRDLLRQAGPRPPMPAERHARVKAAARSAWDEMLEPGVSTPASPRRRAVLAVAATVILALLVGWIWMSGQVEEAPLQVAVVEMEVGADAVGSLTADGSATFEIAVGDALTEGVRLVTSGGEGRSGGRLALRMEGGEAVRLDAGTTVRLATGSLLELERGAVYVDSERASHTDRPLEIATPLGVVHHVGTQYEVRLADGDSAVLVRVREGSVAVRNNGDAWAAKGGEELTLQEDGSVARAVVSPAAEIWSWTLAAAPALDIEGMPLDLFLDWVARETGWRVEYEDEALAASAAQIILHGTIEGLRPDESVGAIVEGSGLAHSVEDGVLYVSRP